MRSREGCECVKVYCKSCRNLAHCLRLQQSACRASTTILTYSIEEGHPVSAVGRMPRFFHFCGGLRIMTARAVRSVSRIGVLGGLAIIGGRPSSLCIWPSPDPLRGEREGKRGSITLPCLPQSTDAEAGRSALAASLASECGDLANM